MPKKNMTPEERKAWGEKMKAARAAAKQKREQSDAEPQLAAAPEPSTAPEVPKAKASGEVPTDIAPELSTADLMAQINELKAYIFDHQRASASPQGGGVGVNKENKLVGEVEKYLVDPAEYPDPTPRLAQEDRLKTIAFEYNYLLKYEVSVSSYETKTGVNMKEPKFTVTLYRAILDEQGTPTGRVYKARILIFHEDPQAAMVVARENGIEITDEKERDFLNEMRYLRVRDWLFDIFWPKGPKPADRVREEVIGGQLVEVYTMNSEQSGEIPFDKLKTKVRS